MNAKQLQSIIEGAFKGVTFDHGISIRQTEVIDRYGEGYTDAEFEALAKQDVTDN